MKANLLIKELLLIFSMLLWIRSEAQNNITKVITINPGENSVSSSLPFDQPIILKWISKDPIVMMYAGLITIKKGDVSKAYRNFAQTNHFYMYQAGSFGNKDVSLDEQTLVTSSIVNTDGKYEINIFLPPLQPNRFYDVKILRKPTSTEQDLFVDLFNSAEDDRSAFERKLKLINAIKKPFELRNNNGSLMTDQLMRYYNALLKKYYGDLKTVKTDKDAAASITSKIKSTLITYTNAYEQSGDYIQIFDAVRMNNNTALANAITALHNAQNGYLVSPDEHHVGTLSDTDLANFYHANSQIATFQNQLAAAVSNDQRVEIDHQFHWYILSLNLPFAEDYFTFGQTLSSSTAVVDFDTRTGYTITPDFGYVYYGFQKDFSSMTPYVGFELEFRYFNKNIPFNLIHPKTLWHRLSFTTGLTLTSIKKDGKRDDFFAAKSLLTGLGVRLTSATRITLGGMWFNREDVNPVLNKKHLTIAPYMGVSIDLKLKSILNDFYSLSPTKKP